MVNCAGSFRTLIGMAEAVACEDLSAPSFFASSGEGDMPNPAGVEMLSENIKSSMFIVSAWSPGCAWSVDFLSWAIPLGADVTPCWLFCFDDLSRE